MLQIAASTMLLFLNVSNCPRALHCMTSGAAGLVPFGLLLHFRRATVCLCGGVGVCLCMCLSNISSHMDLHACLAKRCAQCRAAFAVSCCRNHGTGAIAGQPNPGRSVSDLHHLQPCQGSLNLLLPIPRHSCSRLASGALLEPVLLVRQPMAVLIGGRNQNMAGTYKLFIEGSLYVRHFVPIFDHLPFQAPAAPLNGKSASSCICITIVINLRPLPFTLASTCGFTPRSCLQSDRHDKTPLLLITPDLSNDCSLPCGDPWHAG